MPLWTQMVNFPKHHDDARCNTDRCPAVLRSALGEDPDDPERLAFGQEICFPMVRNGESQDAFDSSAWAAG